MGRERKTKSIRCIGINPYYKVTFFWKGFLSKAVLRKLKIGNLNGG